MRTWLGTGKKLQAGVTACCLVAFILFGYDQGVFSGILQNADWQDQFGHPSDTHTGIIVSSYNLGCLLGCFGALHLAVIFRANDSQLWRW